jgi:hypothetical protein
MFYWDNDDSQKTFLEQGTELEGNATLAVSYSWKINIGRTMF